MSTNESSPSKKTPKRARCVCNNYCCKYPNNQLILILIATSFIIAIGSPIRQVNADLTTIKLTNNSDDHQQSAISLADNSTNKSWSRDNSGKQNQTAIGDDGHRKNGTQVLQQTEFDLMVEDDSSHRFRSIANQSDRHIYNVSFERKALPFVNQPIFFPDGGHRGGFNASDRQQDDLFAADSRYSPKSASSRFDEDIEVIDDDSLTSEADFEAQPPANNFDGQSSNLSEQKVMKELTRMLSKGMSSATDQVGLETLENWKRRQKKRKAIKDTRAKLFEDLLNAAIVSHPEKSKKRNRKRQSSKDEPGGPRGYGSSQVGSSLSAAGSLGLATPNAIDPDMAHDAGNVIQHLQGLAGLIEGGPTSGLSSSDEPQANEELPMTANASSDELSGESSLGNQYENLPTDHGLEEKNFKKGNAGGGGGSGGSSNERPIVRQFKKIKKQISERRKQLDQIKKIFNVELAINPKDGSLMGKSASPSKKFRDNPGGEYGGEDTPPSIISSPLINKKRSKSTKMRDLVHYLKDNPEILSSVMSELTVDADPTKSSAPNEDHYQSLTTGTNEPSYGSPAGGRVYAENADNDDISDRVESLIKLKKSSSSASSSSLSRQSLPDSNLLAASSRQRLRAGENLDGVASLVKPQTLKSKTAETLLLASLRERQLMNLARLEMVLAERQAASNRSHVFSSMGQSTVGQSSASRRDDNQGQSRLRQILDLATLDTQSTEAPQIANPQHQQHQKQQQSQHHYNSNNNNSNNSSTVGQHSDEGEMHHFLVANQNQPIDPQIIRGQTNEAAIRQSVYQYPSINQANQHHQSVTTKLYDQSQPVSQINNSPQQHYAAYSSSSNPSPSSQRYQQQQQQQHQPQQQQQPPSSPPPPPQPSPSRFRDWRDVSQSEASFSQRNDKANPANNITWLANDLTTGSSTNAVEAERSQTHTMNPYKAVQQPFNGNRIHSSVQNETRMNFLANLAQNQHRGYADSSYTRPGPSHFMSLDQSSNYPPTFNEADDSTRFMTRSSMPDPEFTSIMPAKDKPQPETEPDSEPSLSEERMDSSGDNGPNGRYSAPVDYFSAYKQDSDESRMHRKRRNNPTNTGSGSGSGNSNNYPDHMGAMWASK